jgi:hypothetical protein
VSHQPIATKLTYYGDLRAENKAEHERDVAEWERLQHLMHDALEEAAVRAVSTNRLSPEHMTKFQISGKLTARCSLFFFFFFYLLRLNGLRMFDFHVYFSLSKLIHETDTFNYYHE